MISSQHHATKFRRYLLVCLLACFLTCPIAGVVASRSASMARVQANYGQLPLSFEVNRGQFDQQVCFAARGKGYTLSLTPTAASVAGLRMEFVGGNAHPRITGLEPLPGRISYFLGNDPRQWRADVPTFGQVKYEAVYPGIDAVFYGNGRQLEYDFIVAPGADPRAIRLRFDGARRLRLDANGDLLVETHDGELRQHKPIVYQTINNRRRPIAAGYQLIRNPQSAIRNQVRFEVSDYDPCLPLVIDPVLSYATYFGGRDADSATALAVDADGNVVMTGVTPLYKTAPTAFPTTTGALDVTRGAEFNDGGFIFVTKLNRDGTALLYSAIIGGTRGIRLNQSTQFQLDSRSRGLALDAQGNVYVTGSTFSENFPTTPGALQTAGVTDQFNSQAVVFKLNATGSALSYSTLLGRGPADGYSIAVDAAGQAWVTGSTLSRTFPVTANAFQTTKKNNGVTAFAARLNSTGTQLVYSTYLSSGSGETGLSAAVDAAGNAYVSGTTGSSCFRAGDTPVEPFPTTEGAFRRDLGEGCPNTGSYQYVFATKFKADGAIVYSTLFGISNGGSIAADAQGNAYVTGQTVKRYNFPVTPGAVQKEIVGSINTSAAFVAKLNPQGSALVYSTFLNGAKGSEYGSTRLTVDANGNAYVTGEVSSYTFTRTTNEPPFDAEQGIFITRLNAAGDAIPYSVVLGDGSSNAIAVDARASVYIAGHTISNSFPTTPGAFQRQRASLDTTPDAFVLKIDESVATGATHVSSANYSGSALAADSIIAAFGAKLATATESATISPLPTSLAGTSVKVKDSAGVERAAPLFFVSPTQVNYLMPAGTANGLATITISGGGSVSVATVRIASVSPGLFTADASGHGLVAAVVLRIKASGERSYEPVVRYDAALGRMMPMAVDLGPDLGDASDQVFLLLYGTGLRHHNGLAGVSVKIGGVDVPAIYIGAQGDFVGLDQVNAGLPRSLVGRGEADIVVSIDGRPANVTRVWIK